MIKKIKNKNNGNVAIAILLGILIGLLILFFLFGILPNYKETEFTIYKEECWEERYKWKISPNNIIEGRIYWDNETKQICELIEVDEIIIERKFNESCSMFGWTHVSCSVEWDNKTRKGLQKQKGNVLKQDLTIDWLDENCECVEGEYKKKPKIFLLFKLNYYSSYENVDCKKSIRYWENECHGNSQLKSLYTNYCYKPTNQKYKCQNYIVEKN